MGRVTRFDRLAEAGAAGIGGAIDAEAQTGVVDVYAPLAGFPAADQWMGADFQSPFSWNASTVPEDQSTGAAYGLWVDPNMGLVSDSTLTIDPSTVQLGSQTPRAVYDVFPEVFLTFL